jgi:hypothetical protein
MTKIVEKTHLWHENDQIFQMVHKFGLKHVK